MTRAYYKARPDYLPMEFASRREAFRVIAELGLDGCMVVITCYDR